MDLSVTGSDAAGATVLGVAGEVDPVGGERGQRAAVDPPFDQQTGPVGLRRRLPVRAVPSPAT